MAFEGTIHSSLAKASTPWEHFSHGFQLTTSLTAYSPLPFNITTGANTIQGTAARPTINGVFINRNAGEGHAILNLNVRLSRTFALTERMRLQALAEMFNTLNHVNVATLNGVFGTGAYPTNPLADLRTDHGGERSAGVSTGASFEFLGGRMFVFRAWDDAGGDLGPMGPDAPAREPQMAVNGSMVALAFGAGDSIYFSSSSDAGKTFGPPVKVAEAEIIPLDAASRTADRVLRAHDRHHGGRRQDRGGRRACARSAFRRRPDRVALDRRRKALVEGGVDQ